MDRMPFRQPCYRPLCGVAATAMLAGISLERAWRTFRTVCPERDRADWDGSTNVQDRHRVLEYLGLNPETTYPSRRMTLKVYVRDHAPENCPVMVRTKGHAQVVFDGMVFDQCHPDGVPVDRFLDKNRMVTHVTTV